MGGWEVRFASSEDGEFNHSAFLAFAVRGKGQIHAVGRGLSVFHDPIPCGPATIAFQHLDALAGGVGDVNCDQTVSVDDLLETIGAFGLCHSD